MQPSWPNYLARKAAMVGDWLLDPTIVLSFDQTGFVRHRQRFNPAEDQTPLKGRRCVITGANSGLGRATAHALAARGATVHMFCRNLETASNVQAEIIAETQNPNVTVHHMDLGCPESIRSAVDTLDEDSIDVLINNAGALLDQLQSSNFGLEQTLSTNLVGPWAFTAALLPHLRKGEKSRIIWVSSGGMYTQRLNIDHLKTPPSPFDGVRSYAQTKRAMVMLSERLASELKASGIAVHCMHPGWANTPGVEQSLPLFWRITKPILRTADSGADTIIWLASCDRAQQHSGKFWFDREARSTHLLPGTRSSQDIHENLWESIHSWANVDPLCWTA